ncbi:UNVERIFIED_CONTAM: 1-phosphofructokinase/tagatose 6-phosphate kinase [Acetivibrio alkalicellulosi]
MITTVALNPAVDKIYFIEDFKVGKMFRTDQIIKSAGGKGINVARVCKILGERVLVIGFKAGYTGDWIEKELVSIGVDVNFVKVEGEIRTNNNIIDKKNKTETEVLEIGHKTKLDDINRFLTVFDGILKQTKVLVLSGGLPQGCPNDFYKVLIEKAKFKNTLVILDTSGEFLIEGIKAKPDMIKPNLRELSTIVNKQLTEIDDIVKVCKDIVRSGIAVVTVSMGDKGALLVTKEETLFAKVPSINAVNTIGSGDSLVAAFAVGFQRGYNIDEAFKFAMACGVNNTQYIQVGKVNKTEVIELEKQIVIERL